MSKTIDISQGVAELDDDDLLYLAQRDNQEAIEELANRGKSIDGSQAPPIDQVPHTGSANTAGETIEDLEKRLERMRAEQAAGDDDAEGRLGPDDYADATNDDLRTEIVLRNEDRDPDDQLSISGNKAALIAELERDDAEAQEG